MNVFGTNCIYLQKPPLHAHSVLSGGARPLLLTDVISTKIMC